MFSRLPIPGKAVLLRDHPAVHVYSRSGFGTLAALTVLPISAGPAALDYSVGSMSLSRTRMQGG